MLKKVPLAAISLACALSTTAALAEPPLNSTQWEDSPPSAEDNSENEAEPEPPPPPPPPPPPESSNEASGEPLWPEASSEAGQEPAKTVIVSIRFTEPGVGVTVSTRDKKILATCKSACRVRLVPGRYIFNVHPGDSTVGGKRALDVQGPMRITFDPDTTDHRYGGLGLGIAGPIAMIVGLGLAISGARVSVDCTGSECNQHTRTDETRIRMGLLTMLGGMGATALGWTMFGTSIKPEYEIESLNSTFTHSRRTLPQRSLQLGVVGYPGGGGLGARLAF